MGPLGIAGIMAGSQLLGGMIGAGTQASLNKSTQAWNERMYGRQLQDNIMLWNLQNEYNSPSAQMARFKAAGLNPNLIYGQTNTADAVRSSDVKSWNPTNPDFSFVGDSFKSGLTGMLAHADIEQKGAQTNNIRAQTAVAVEDAALRAAQIVSTNAQTAATLTGTDRAKFELEMAKALAPYQQERSRLGVEADKLDLQKRSADIKFTLNQDERAAALNAQTLREGAERILNMRLDRAKTDDERKILSQQLENLKSDQRLKLLDIKLKESGVQPHDAWWLRMLIQYLEKTPNKMQFPED